MRVASRLRRRVLAAIVALAAMLFGACQSQSTAPTVVQFSVRHDGVEPGCGTRFGPNGELRLTDLRFYVSEFSVRGRDGEWIDAPMAGQRNHVELIDLEDGTADCQNGSASTNRDVALEILPGDYDTLRFTLGVPAKLNHADPLLAKPPLDNPAMHWHWQSGYKFLRIGIAKSGQRWHAHLGSTGCRPAADGAPHCTRPNRARIEVSPWDANVIVVLDLEELLRDIDAGSASTAHCLGDIDNPACTALLQRLGVDPQSGEPDTRSVVFRSEVTAP